MDTPREAIDFLVSSKNRTQALELLAEQPHTRSELQDETDASRKTIGRLLGEFVERGWVQRDGPEYRTTRLGDLIATDIATLLDTTTTVQHLRDVIEYLPTDEMDIDLRRFSDVEYVFPNRSEPNAPLTRLFEALRTAEVTRILSSSVTTEGLQAVQNGIDDHDQRTTSVYPATTLDNVAADPSRAELFREIIEAERASIRSYDGEVPQNNIIVADGTVLLGLLDERGSIHAMLKTEDETIRSWALETIDAYKCEAELVGPERFSTD